MRATFASYRPSVLLVASMVLLAASGCRQAKPPTPPPETQPTAIIPSPQTMPAREAPQTQPAVTTQPGERPRHFEVSETGPIKPDRKLTADQPLAILAKLDHLRPGTLRARLVSDTLLTIDTDNVQALRLDLLNLPREQAGRLILHIDGQGIEITGRNNKIIYLQRSSTGEWSFGRPAGALPAPVR